MTLARDVMHPAQTVASHATVEELARQLLDGRLDGVCVVDGGALRGVVTTMDLIYQEQPVHLPSFLVFLDAIIPFGSGEVEQEIRKIAGSTVAEIMTTDVHSVHPETPIEEVAELMVEHHITIVPVVDGKALVGVIDKQAMLRAAFPKQEASAE